MTTEEQPTESLSQQLKDTYEQYIMPTYAPGMSLVKGKGSYVWDAEGKKYLDFLSGIAVNSLGHSHPALLKALRKQSGKLMHCSNLYINEQAPRLAERLSKLSLGGKVFLCNSGAEANEALIKLARFHGSRMGKNEIITVSNSFHGRTLATLTATGQEKVHRGFSPLVPGFSYATLNDMDSIRQAANDRTIAVLLEPLQGEGGVIKAKKGFMQELRKFCDANGLMLLMDEIQTGVGRTGKWFGYQHFDVEPDAISLAKGLGGGFPVGAVVSNEKYANTFEPGTHGTTFGGNPLACAVANAVLDTLDKQEWVDKAAERGQFMKKRLQKLVEKYDFIEEVRGEGLMLGLVMDRPAKALENILTRKGLITLATAERVIRMLPPLNVSTGEMRKALKILSAGCQEWQNYLTEENEE